jgi:hypothetical protein
MATSRHSAFVHDLCTAQPIDESTHARTSETCNFRTPGADALQSATLPARPWQS